MPFLFKPFVVTLLLLDRTYAFTSTPFGMARPIPEAGRRELTAATTTLTMTGRGEDATPSTFREAEVLGLKLMQEQKYVEALKGRYSCMALTLSLVWKKNVRGGQ